MDPTVRSFGTPGNPSAAHTYNGKDDDMLSIRVWQAACDTEATEASCAEDSAWAIAVLAAALQCRKYSANEFIRANTPGGVYRVLTAEQHRC